MEALTQLFIALLAIGVSAGSHYFFLGRIKQWLSNAKLPTFVTLLMVFYGITFSQLTAALWFAIGFETFIYLGLGSFVGVDPIAFIDIFYFSLINLTTLGMANIEPLRHLNLLVGLEAMTGFLLVSCSATLIFKTMKH
jgi:hypothetical protein